MALTSVDSTTRKLLSTRLSSRTPDLTDPRDVLTPRGCPLECRSPWREDFGPEWTRSKIAQFRWDPEDGTWTIWWADRNGRWLHYPDAEPAADIGELLRVLDTDRSGAFGG